MEQPLASICPRNLSTACANRMFQPSPMTSLSDHMNAGLRPESKALLEEIHRRSVRLAGTRQGVHPGDAEIGRERGRNELTLCETRGNLSPEVSKTLLEDHQMEGFSTERNALTY
jgi:hypothetical protein